ncbi:MAG: hemolysin family protein, partial [Gordonibacter sp.]
IVVGELIPKSLAIFSTERWALLTATPLVWFYRITYPVMWLFNSITNGVMKLLGHDIANEHEVYTDEEIKLLIDESTESGLIDPEQNEYVDNIFDLGDKDAEAIMTPRTDVICLDLEDSLEENMDLIRQYKYTRYPVCRGSKDRIVGFVHVKDLYTMPAESTLDDLRIRTIQAVPEGIAIAKLLQTLQEKRTKIAVVIDEHGGTSGIVTMSDIMEQIVGRIDDEYQHGESHGVVELEDGSLLVDGSMPVGEVEELIGFKPVEAEECETAGGLLLSLFDRIPNEGDTVTVEDDGDKATFTVLDMDRHRIDKIRVIVEHAEKAVENGK